MNCKCLFTITRFFTVLLVSFLFSATADSLTAQTITHVPLYTLTGDIGNGELFGTSVSGAGDVNGDGFADLIVGAPRNDNNGTSNGSARVFSGIDGTVLYNFDGDSAGDQFGRSVSGAGDVNGDGFADLIVGASRDANNGNDSGSARVFSGIDGSVLYDFDGDDPGDGFGTSVSGAGDVNGDGFADLIVGAPRDDNNGHDSGSARVLSGSDGSVLYTFNGGAEGNILGHSVSDAGDVNGDGFADLIVGASDPRPPFNKIARVLSGSDGSVLYDFNLFSDLLITDNTSVSGAGDVNGDGFSDLIVAVTSINRPIGSARVFSGSDGSVLYDFDGFVVSALGVPVSGAGDVNGDGFSDLIVGDPRNINNGFSNGSARVLSGIDGSILYNFDGGAGDILGFSVSGAGDVNGDGIDDFIVGSLGGFARVFVSQISLLGDVNQDGVVDFSDIPAFISILLSGDYLVQADTNEDGVVDFSDIPFFIEILLAS